MSVEIYTNQCYNIKRKKTEWLYQKGQDGVSFTVDRYIKETRSIKKSLNSNDEKTFKKLYYGTFPLMEHKELPELNIFSTYDMDTKVINSDGIWHLIFDCNLYGYIQLFIYS